MGFYDSIRMNSLAPPAPSGGSNYDGGFNDLVNQIINYRKSQKDRQNQIEDVALQHQMTPINRYDPNTKLTTNPLVSMGLTPANTQIDSKAVPNQIDPLKLATLQQKDRVEAGRNTRNTEDNKTKEDIAKSNESGRNVRHEEDTNIRKQRADVYEFKARNPNHIIKFAGDRIIAIDPQTNKTTDLGSSGGMKDEDKLILMNDLGIQRDNNRSTNTANNNNARDLNRHLDTLGEIDARGEQTRETNKEKPVANKNKPLLPAQRRTELYGKAEQLANTNPAYKKRIKLDPASKSFTISGSDDDEFHMINSQIYGSDVSIPSSNSSDKSDNSSKPDPLGIR